MSVTYQSGTPATPPNTTKIKTTSSGDGEIQHVIVDDLPALTSADVVTVTGGTGQAADVKVTLDSEQVSVKFVDENGTAYGVKHVQNKPRVSSMSYLYDIAEGNIADHSEFERFGYNGDIDQTAEDVWSTGGSYVFPTSDQQLELVSTSVEDDILTAGAIAGTGIHTVTLYYLDNTYAARTEDITLNGTGVVTTTATNILRVNSLKAKVVGSTGAAVGTITIRNLANTPIYSQIDPGNTRSRSSVYTVPLGKTLYITSIFVGCGAATATTATVTLQATYDHDASVLRTFFMPHAEVIVGSGSGGVYRPFELPIKMPATTDIKCRSTTTANNTIVSASLRGWLE